MDWVRTGKITLRAGDYLIIRYILEPQYMALHGPVAGRTAIGRYLTVGDAQQACKDHEKQNIQLPQ